MVCSSCVTPGCIHAVTGWLHVECSRPGRPVLRTVISANSGRSAWIDEFDLIRIIPPIDGRDDEPRAIRKADLILPHDRIIFGGLPRVKAKLDNPGHPFIGGRSALSEVRQAGVMGKVSTVLVPVYRKRRIQTVGPFLAVSRHPLPVESEAVHLPYLDCFGVNVRSDDLCIHNGTEVGGGVVRCYINVGHACVRIPVIGMSQAIPLN